MNASLIVTSANAVARISTGRMAGSPNTASTSRDVRRILVRADLSQARGALVDEQRERGDAEQRDHE